jgi:hypothetical protein
MDPVRPREVYNAISAVRDSQIGGLVRNRDGVIVDNAEERLVFVLQLNPVLDGAEVVSDVQGSRRAVCR